MNKVNAETNEKTDIILNKPSDETLQSVHHVINNNLLLVYTNYLRFLDKKTEIKSSNGIDSLINLFYEDQKSSFFFKSKL